MLKYNFNNSEVNDNVKKFIKENYHEDELRNELGSYDPDLSDEEIAGQSYVDAPHFIANNDGTKVWFVCSHPERHVNGVDEEVDIVDFEMKHNHKTLPEVAQELGVDYAELKDDYDNMHDDDDAWSNLNELIINNNSVIDMKYGDNEDTIVFY